MHKRRLSIRVAALLLCASVTPTAWSLSFDIPFGDESIEAASNTTITFGAAMRVESRADDLTGKSSLNPEVCPRAPDGVLYYQACQGLFREQTFTAEHLARAPGAASSNLDRGNLNYNRGDLTQAPLKLTQDLNFSFGDFGLFAKGLFFYDFINNSFTEYHPNRITRENSAQLGYVSTPGKEIIRPGVDPTPTLGVRTDSIPCPENRNPSGQPCGIVYGSGAASRQQRRDAETLREIGHGFQLLDVNVYGNLPIGNERKLSFKLGRQLANWGESTVMIFDSMNVINPPNINNFFRVGAALDELQIPLNMANLSVDLFDGASLSGIYLFEWKPIGTPPPGSYYSPVNLGTNNAGPDYVLLGFGQFADDPDSVGRLLDNPLSGVTNTTVRVERLRDREPAARGQYGFEFKYYADWLNNGTELGLYYLNYHSRNPFASVYSVDQSCAKDVTTSAALRSACPDLPVFHALTAANDPDGASSDIMPLDTLKVVLEYPRNVQLLGASFNTTVGDISIQGEVAYRPDEPLQVAVTDLAFAAFGPTLTNCHLPDAGCAGSNVGVGVQPDGSVGNYSSSDFVIDANGTRGAYADTFDAVVGALPGAGRSFPSFIIPYRGGVVGTNPPNTYIRGWENFDTWQFDLGSTYVQGATDLIPQLIGADQFIFLFETAARYVPGLPPLDRLQLEGAGLTYHASAGADGSGADGSRQACSTNMACSYGPDGLRFNPHQADLSLFPTQWSGGYALVGLFKYESVLPGISLQPLVIFKHDVFGHSPGVVSNFVEGRMLGDFSVELRYKSALSFTVGYQLFAGGGSANGFRDRDNLRVSAKYAF